ncbi:hypothetical protein FKG96_09855 [Olivibacter sp. LS-1]|uniref:hypothetical protein n=1 Tax=Olivibacter sp. LS-1 TaxID=2592345 RepID=UPI0011EB80AA|nr:hypothetical protein [Olivibacter sp. LS-1]QEL01097.1 hypothetical protein FKG96_09855 [Olivibacter sp. LS-1]
MINPTKTYTFTYLDNIHFRYTHRAKQGKDWFLYFKFVAGREGVFGAKETEVEQKLKLNRWKEITP